MPHHDSSMHDSSGLTDVYVLSALLCPNRGFRRVIPYINGQLYDTRIPRWTNDNASEYVQKFTAETMSTPGHAPDLSPHLEHFDGITSAVMCPATSYWHDVMRDAMLKIVNEVGFDGVYVDQVGNGESCPVPFREA